MTKPVWTEFQGGYVMVLDCAILMVDRIHSDPWAGAYRIRFGLQVGAKFYWNEDEAKSDAVELAKKTLKGCLLQLDKI